MDGYAHLRCQTCHADVLVDAARVVFDGDGFAVDASERVEKPESAWLRCPFHPSRVALLRRIDAAEAEPVTAEPEAAAVTRPEPEREDPRDVRGDGLADGLDAVTLRFPRPRS